MSDKMTPLSLTEMYESMMTEFKRFSTIWGIEAKTFFNPSEHEKLITSRFDQLLESPIGVAAGPQTQMTQNIIASWLTGSRYIELKTVQVLDDLEVKKPCIDMEDEGFNTEWSQELSLEESYEEYLKAYVLIYALREKLNLKRKIEKNGDELGTIFNMSVGYDLKGVKSPKVMKFLTKMLESSSDIDKYLKKLQEIDSDLKNIVIKNKGLTNNITLSTMHGCPPDEVEQIASFLIKDLKIHTTVKLNPTLNGPHDVRKILNHEMGYTNVIVPDIAFEHDLKFEDATKIIRRLQTLSKENNVHFGIKLTNTLETQNVKGILPKENEMNYMSGRALHPLAINLAKKLISEFSGEIDISFSAGADAFNVAEILKCGLRPITVSSDLLKPGGYMRLYQYFINIEKEMAIHEAKDLEELVLSGNEHTLKKDALIRNISEYHGKVLKDKRYHKEMHPWDNIKTNNPLNVFDCVKAPCVSTCPTTQEIPTYMRHTANGDFDLALKTIEENNPLPHTTGMACDHICTDKCTRMNYDNPLQIRDIKRFVAKKGLDSKEKILKPKRKLNKRVSIIGGGPSGLSCAYFLALEGFQVDIYEAKKDLGGMISFALPDFRTIPERVNSDIERIKSLGVKIHLGHEIKDENDFKEIEKKSDYVYLAIGAKKSKLANIPGENLKGCYDFLSFLEGAKTKKITEMPKRVLVIGGGNSAIDTVRSAKRLQKNHKDAEIYLVYRRGREDMPAHQEEIFELDEEKIKVLDFLAPVEVVGANGCVTGLKVQGTKKVFDQNGKVKLENIPNTEQILLADTVIFAIGQDREMSFLPKDFHLGQDGKVNDKIFAGGDLVRGPSSIIKGIADGKNTAYKIFQKEGIDVSYDGKRHIKVEDHKKLMMEKSLREFGVGLPRTNHSTKDFKAVIDDMSDEMAMAEAKRCLSCDEICSICVTVCPNRANLTYFPENFSLEIPDINFTEKTPALSNLQTYATHQKYQTMNIGDFCNECGNCATFCPTKGKPYKDKPKIYFNKEKFLSEGKGDISFHFDRSEKSLKFYDNGTLFQLDTVSDASFKLTSDLNGISLNFEMLPFKIGHYKRTSGTSEKVKISGDYLFTALVILKSFMSGKIQGQ